MVAVALSNLTLGYDRHPAVHHLDTTIPSGSLTAVVGPNGAGKSTLLKGITGALRPLEGSIGLREGGARIAYLPQQAEIERGFPLSVAEFVAMGLWGRIGAFGAASRSDQAGIATALSAVGMDGTGRRPIGALSGGQMQRVLFARLLLQEADLILLDEPFTAIDATTAADLMRIVHRWHGDGRTVIAVLHDLEAVRAHFPTTLMLSREMIAHGPTEATLTAENLFRARQMAAGGGGGHGAGAAAAPCARGAAA
jgi:zinc/manganese transport system ATP-binding protein